MDRDTIQRLEQDFSRHPVTVAGSVSTSRVRDLERDAGFVLPADYKEFVARYGGAIVGPYPIYGLRAAKAMGKNEGSALEVTSHFRSEGWSGTEDWLVISTDHAGSPVGLDRDGRVWIADHDAGEVVVIAGDFEEYLRVVCLGLSGASGNQT